MGFKTTTAKSGIGQRSNRLSIAAAPYQVNLKNGRRQMYGRLREIYQDISMDAVLSVFDRHAGAYLDIESLWLRHRRRFLPSKK